MSSTSVAARPRTTPMIAPIGPSTADPVTTAATKVVKPTANPAAILSDAAAIPGALSSSIAIF